MAPSATQACLLTPPLISPCFAFGVTCSTSITFDISNAQTLCDSILNPPTKGGHSTHFIDFFDEWNGDESRLGSPPNSFFPTIGPERRHEVSSHGPCRNWLLLGSSVFELSSLCGPIFVLIQPGPTNSQGTSWPLSSLPTPGIFLELSMRSTFGS